MSKAKSGRGGKGGSIAAPVDMPANRSDLAVDDPEAYIPRDRRRALATGSAMPDRVHGAGLFADISGFTPLTEALAAELGPQRGAEELTAALSRVFHAVIAEHDRFGGDVIYFSGDAITCWIDGDDGVRATAAAIAMQAAIARVGTVVTPAGSIFTLGMKVAIAVGSARRFVVGDPSIQLIDVLAGRLVDQLAEAEHHAQKGEIVLDATALATVGPRVDVTELRIDPDTGRSFGVVSGLAVEVADAPSVEPGSRLPDDLVRPWLLPAVYERLRAGRGEFLADLRPAFPLFLRFGGIDYDDDDDAIVKLDDLVQGAQRIMSRFGGNVLQLTLGDKGAYLYGVFGSPIAHEDDAARAAAAALELRDLERTTAATGVQIGITHGRLRSGTYGHEMRRTFVCLGDAVNLAARLMSAAPPGQIYVSEAVQRSAGDAFHWGSIPDLTVKGKSAAVVVYALNGSLARASRRQTRYTLPLIGRRTELEMIQTRLKESREGRGQVIGIAAEAGMGKSRLLAEFIRIARRRGQSVAFGECQSFGANSSYFAWREIWRVFLGIDDGDGEQEQRASLERALATIDPILVERAPLLEAVVGLTIPDTDVTRSFDAKLRKTSLEDLLATCLRAVAVRPQVIVIEDCHWIDGLSRDLLETLVRTAAALPVLFVLAYRPATSIGGGMGLERLPQFAEIALDELDATETRLLIRSKLGQLLASSGDASAEASNELVDLITDRSGGNAFYVEELLIYLLGKGIDPGDPGALGALELPDSLQSLVLSRIDTIGEAPRRTLKVASVIGRVFHGPVLPGVYPELGTPEVVRDQLDILRAAELVSLDQEAEQAYLFKHVVTQEVAYESLPFAIRAMLHRRVGAYIEATAAGSIELELDVLAHHYSRSDDAAKKIEYLGRAGAAAQAGYANAAAIDYYERLVPLLAGSECVEAMLNLGKILQLVGDLPRAESVVLEARAIAVSSGTAAQVAWCDASLAETARRQSHYEATAERLATALSGFRDVGDDAGAAAMLHLAGVVAQHRGDYDEARERYSESRLIRAGLGDWSGVAATDANLAILAEFAGDNLGAFELNERSLKLRREIGDRRGIGIGEMNAGYYGLLLGRTDESLARLEVALAISREIGDRAMISHSLRTLADGHRNAGNYPRAAELYAAAIRSYRDLGNEFELGFILEDVAILCARALDGAIGFRLLGAAEALRARVGSPRPPALEAELEHTFATAREAIGSDMADQAIEAGRAMSLEDALSSAEMAFAVLAGTGDRAAASGSM